MNGIFLCQAENIHVYYAGTEGIGSQDGFLGHLKILLGHFKYFEV
jgi:hypothetical protein